jgi:hypothetical protein
MKTLEPSSTSPDSAGNQEGTGVPWFRTWRSVYAFVLGCFVVWVLLLLVLTEVFR